MPLVRGIVHVVGRVHIEASASMPQTLLPKRRDRPKDCDRRIRNRPFTLRAVGFSTSVTLMDKVPLSAHGVANRRIPMFGDKPKHLPQAFALVLLPSSR